MANSTPEANRDPSVRRVLLCVSGSISAYKAADVVSTLVKGGHEVQCLMTESATHFVTPTVLETLSGRPALRTLFGPGISGTEHIRLARWADIIVFAPATAHLLAKLSLGLADDLVTTVALATQAPWLIAPAMNTVMWEQPVVLGHIEVLRSRGARFIEPAEGRLACGEEGAGKLASVESIVEEILQIPLGSTPQNLAGEIILITAGPTRSHLDAVRYLTNPSTGKMGAALAREALRRGAEVRYVLGVDKGVVRPEAPQGTEKRLKITEVLTAEEMFEAASRELPACTGVVATAAVLDYRVDGSLAHKQKRAREAVTLRLVPSVDVLGGLRELARPGQWFLGFAAETDDVEGFGRAKLSQKNLDFLFANRVARQNESLPTGFGSNTNAGTLLKKGGQSLEISLRSKDDLAAAIWDRVPRSPEW